MSLLESSSHRALACYDVLIAIFDHFLAPEDAWFDYDSSIGDSKAWYSRRAEAERRTTLARCARVCRAFSAPAIAVLWKDIDTLSPLVNAIGASDGNAQVPHRVRAQARTDEYVQHVRAVHGSRGSPHSVPNSKALPLLPSLRHLRWVQEVPGNTTILQVIPPSLRSLHVVFRKSPEWQNSAESSSRYETLVGNLLRDIAREAPELRYLRIDTVHGIPESWFAPINGFTHLESVDILERTYTKPDTTPLLPSLSSLSRLEHLKLRLSGDFNISSLPADAFPSLKTTTLDAMYAPISAVSAFLSSISSAHLSTLLIQNCECANGTIFRDVYETCDVIRSRFASSLRRLELALRGPEGVTANDLANLPLHPLASVLEPLLALRDLEDVLVSIAPEVALAPASPREFVRLARAWPKAKRIQLRCDRTNALPSAVELSSFARHCANLEELVLPGLDGSPSTSVESDPGADDEDDDDNGTEDPGPAAVLPERPEPSLPPVARTLRAFSLADDGWRSKIPDPAALAEKLDVLFPDVEWRCPPNAADHWRETVQEVVRLRIVRMLG